MKHRFLQIALFALGLVVLPITGLAQRISFGLWAGEGLALNTVGGATELDFNSMVTVILPGNQAIDIFKDDDASVVMEIHGRIDLDVTVTIDADDFLELQVGETVHLIPLSVRFAFHNIGLPVYEDLPEVTIKDQAVAVPDGFGHATFAMQRRLGGPPAPPPTPDHEGHVQPKGKSYLVVYGKMGEVPLNAAAGEYLANINIRVEYSTYEP